MSHTAIYKDSASSSVPGGEVKVGIKEVKNYDRCKILDCRWTDGSKIQLKVSPLRTNWGASSYEGSGSSWSITLTLDNKDPKAQNIKKFLSAIDESNKANILALNGKDFGFDKKKITKEMVENSYKPLVKENSPYDPTINIKINVGENGIPSVDFYQHNESTGKLDKLPALESANSMTELIPKKSILNAAFTFTGITVIHDKKEKKEDSKVNFYPKLLVTQIGLIDTSGTGDSGTDNSKCHINVDNWEETYNHVLARVNKDKAKKSSKGDESEDSD